MTSVTWTEHGEDGKLICFDQMNQNDLKSATLAWLLRVYNMTQRQPAVGSSPSSLVFEPLPVFAFSSSSTTSCGLMVM